MLQCKLWKKTKLNSPLKSHVCWDSLYLIDECFENTGLKLWFYTKENRIYIRVEFSSKMCKTAILLYCFHTAGVLYIFVLYNLLGPGPSFYRKSKINIKRKPNYEIDWFHNWPMIISHRLYGFHFTNDDFPL